MTDWSPLLGRGAGVALVVGGAVNLGTGLWLASLTGNDAVWQWLLAVAVERYGEAATLVNGALVSAAVNVGAPAVAALLCVVAAVGLFGGWVAFQGDGARWPFVAAIVGAVNPLAVPVSAVAVVLLFLSGRMRSATDRATTDGATND